MELTDLYFYGPFIVIIVILVAYYIIQQIKKNNKQQEIEKILKSKTDENEEELSSYVKNEFGNPISTIVYVVMFLGGPIAIYRYLRKIWDTSPEGSPLKIMMILVIMIIAAFILLSVVRIIERKIYRDNTTELYEKRESNLYER